MVMWRHLRQCSLIDLLTTSIDLDCLMGSRAAQFHFVGDIHLWMQLHLQTTISSGREFLSPPWQGWLQQLPSADMQGVQRSPSVPLLALGSCCLGQTNLPKAPSGMANSRQCP